MDNAALPDSLWQMKPWWCQPWSIVLTGCLLPAIAWLLTHRLWLTAPVGVGVLGWWTLFLYLVPKQYAIAVKEQRQAEEG
ncbi:MAG: DUF6737 family protein [Cyanobacteria bacterium P01_H01_bin.58]